MAPQPQAEAASPAAGERSGMRCPRCESNNTKFCYYNNYSLSQPRHFCKTCRRYWTQGGSLRNIPLGGASRRIKKPSSSTSRPPSAGIDHLAGISPAVDFQVAGSGFYPTNLSPFGDHHHHHHHLVGAAGAGGIGPILDLLPDIRFNNHSSNSFGDENYYWKEQRIALPLLYGGGDKDKGYQNEQGGVGPADVMNYSNPILLSGDQEIISNPHHSYHGYDNDQNDDVAAVAGAGNEQIMMSTPPAASTATPQWLFSGGQQGCSGTSHG